MGNTWVRILSTPRFSCLNMSFHCILPLLFSDKKSAVNLTESPCMYVMRPFKIVFCILNVLLWYVWVLIHWIYSLWRSLSFWDTQINVLDKISKILNHYLFKYSFIPFPVFLSQSVLLHWSLRFCSFSSFFPVSYIG